MRTSTPPRTRALAWLPIGAVCAAIGGAGYALGRRGDPPPSPPAPARAPLRDERMELVLAGQNDLRSRLGRLETELATRATPPGELAAKAPPTAAALSAEPEQLPSTPEVAAAMDRAHAVLADASDSGVWTPSHRERMREAFGLIGDEGRKVMLQEFAQAVNAGKVSLAGLSGPPL